MCSAPPPSDFIVDGRLRVRRNLRTTDNEYASIKEFTPNSDYLVSAMIQLEAKVMSSVTNMGCLKFGWVLTSRLYFFTLFHLATLSARHSVSIDYESEHFVYHLFENFNGLDHSPVPSSIAHELSRAVLPHVSDTNILLVPDPRSGLYVSQPTTTNADGITQFSVWFTPEYQSIPCLRILTNLLWLVPYLKNRPQIPRSNKVIFQGLVLGRITDCNVYINGAIANYSSILQTLFDNPVFRQPVISDPKLLHKGILELHEDLTSEVFNGENPNIFDQQDPQPWLEPHITPSNFDVLRHVSGSFSAISNNVYTNHHVIDNIETTTDESLDEIISMFGPTPSTNFIPISPRFWIQVILG